MTNIPLDIPPGLRSDDTNYAASPAWVDGSHVRFRLGKPQTCGGWESIISDLLTGVCRAVFAWTQNDGTLNIAAGTHSKLQLWQGGALYDITPFGPPTRLGSAPFATTNGSATVTVTHTAHGLTTGNSVIISGAVDTNGIVAANLNGTRTITVTGTDAYTFTAGGNASSTGTGGGTVVVIVPQVTLPAGNIDGTGSNGYGVGGYGIGGYGEPSTADYFPRTWSLAAWGQKLLASPRNGGLYEWTNNTANKALAIPTAPDRITQMLVSPQRQVFALGCTQENGTWNPLCLRHSAVEDNTLWTTATTSESTAREYILPGGGRIVGGKFIGRYLLVWTASSLFMGTYVGQIGQVWRFDRVGDKCGLIGPNAVGVLGNTAYWVTPDKQFQAYSLGGAVQPLPCPVRADFADNLALGQSDKIIASTTAQFGEIRWDYPDDRDGFEVSRYIAVCVEGPDAGAWFTGREYEGVSPARTARFDAGPAANPVGVTYGGNLYWEESGHSADGGSLSWFLQSSDLYLDENNALLVREAWPDIEPDQIGPVSLTITARMYAQSETHETVGPFTIASTSETIDFKVSGRLFQIAYAGYSAPSYARIGRLVVDAKARGRRG